MTQTVYEYDYTGPGGYVPEVGQHAVPGEPFVSNVAIDNPHFVLRKGPAAKDSPPPVKRARKSTKKAPANKAVESAPEDKSVEVVAPAPEEQ